MCNLWFGSRIHAHLLLLSSTLSSNTVIGLLMAILSLVLLTVNYISIWMRVVTVTLSGICILGEHRLLVRLLLYLLIVRIHRTLKRSETCCTTLHWLTQSIAVEYTLVIANWLTWSAIVDSCVDGIYLCSTNYRWAPFIIRVVCNHIYQMSLTF